MTVNKRYVKVFTLKVSYCVLLSLQGQEPTVLL